LQKNKFSIRITTYLATIQPIPTIYNARTQQTMSINRLHKTFINLKVKRRLRQYRRKNNHPKTYLNTNSSYNQQLQQKLNGGKIFQIGFSKCGTTSLHNFFINHGVLGAHYSLTKDLLYASNFTNDYFQDKLWQDTKKNVFPLKYDILNIENTLSKNKVQQWDIDDNLKEYCLFLLSNAHTPYNYPMKYSTAVRMHITFLAKKPLLSLLPNDIIFHGDMQFPLLATKNNNNNNEYIANNIQGFKHYKLLDKQYPKSRFILNIRCPKKWLTSCENAKYSRFQLLSFAYPDKLRAILLKEWEQHITEVTDYFSSQPEKLLIFNIEEDSPEKINDFFNVDFDTSQWGHHNKTKKETA